MSYFFSDLEKQLAKHYIFRVKDLPISGCLMDQHYGVWPQSTLNIKGFEFQTETVKMMTTDSKWVTWRVRVFLTIQKDQISPPLVRSIVGTEEDDMGVAGLDRFRGEEEEDGGDDGDGDQSEDQYDTDGDDTDSNDTDKEQRNNKRDYHRTSSDGTEIQDENTNSTDEEEGESETWITIAIGYVERSSKGNVPTLWEGLDQLKVQWEAD